MASQASNVQKREINKRLVQVVWLCSAIMALQFGLPTASRAADIAGTRFKAEFQTPSKAEEIAQGLPFRQPNVVKQTSGTISQLADPSRLQGPRLAQPKLSYAPKAPSGSVVSGNGALEYVPGSWNHNAGRIAMLAEKQTKKTEENDDKEMKPNPCASERVGDIRPMSEINADIQVVSGSLLDCLAVDGDTGFCCEDCDRCWPRLCYPFAATGMHHNPLYFEEVNLERYGYGCHPCLQASASAAHFFVRVAGLPYMMAVDCPWECTYTLGHYRPGNCVPWRHHCGPF